MRSGYKNLGVRRRGGVSGTAETYPSERDGVGVGLATAGQTRRRRRWSDNTGQSDGGRNRVEPGDCAEAAIRATVDGDCPMCGDADVEDSCRYQTISRVRARFGRLEEDFEALGEHGNLADELREIVCRGESS